MKSIEFGRSLRSLIAICALIFNKRKFHFPARTQLATLATHHLARLRCINKSETYRRALRIRFIGKQRFSIWVACWDIWVIYRGHPINSTFIRRLRSMVPPARYRGKRLFFRKYVRDPFSPIETETISMRAGRGLIERKNVCPISERALQLHPRALSLISFTGNLISCAFSEFHIFSSYIFHSLNNTSASHEFCFLKKRRD